MDESNLELLFWSGIVLTLILLMFLVAGGRR